MIIPPSLDADSHRETLNRVNAAKAAPTRTPLANTFFPSESVSDFELAECFGVARFASEVNSLENIHIKVVSIPSMVASSTVGQQISTCDISRQSHY